MLSAVFDTVVFVRALINPRSVCGQVVTYAMTNRYRLILSRPIVVEIVEVLQRPEITRRFRRLESLDADRVLDILSRAEIVEPIELPAVSRDPNDDTFVATARAAKADYLVTQDQDLLVLGAYEGTRVVTCTEFLRRLENEA